MLRSPFFRNVLAVALAMAAAPAAAADVLVVAHDGTGDHATIEMAVQLAAPGDIVLVRDGYYQPIGHNEPDSFVEISKSLTLVGEGAGPITGLLRVTGLAADETVVVRNMRFASPIGMSVQLETVGVFDSLGAVIFEDCSMTGRVGSGSSVPGSPGLRVKNSTAVSLTRCTVKGGAGGDTIALLNFGNGPGGPGVLVETSQLALHHGTVLGGRGGTDSYHGNGSAPGGDGLVSTSSILFLAGGSVTGGAGSNGSPPAEASEGAGGDGLLQSGTGSWLRSVGLTASGGAGGVLSDGSSAPAGQGLLILAGLVETHPEAARSLRLDPMLHEGETGTLSLGGPPGDTGKVMLSLGAVYAQLGGKKGVYTLADPVVGPIVLGEIPASGQLDVAVPVGSLLGLEGLLLRVQGFSYGNGGFVMTNPTECVLLEAGL